MRYDQFGDMGHPIDRMAHKFNMTVPGVLGYKPQTTKGPEDLEHVFPGGSFIPEGDIGSPYGNNYSDVDSFGGE